MKTLKGRVLYKDPVWGCNVTGANYTKREFLTDSVFAKFQFIKVITEFPELMPFEFVEQEDNDVSTGSYFDTAAGVPV